MSRILHAITLLGGLAGITVGFGQTTASWPDGIHYTASATAAWTDNISRTSYEPTRKDAASYELTFGATQARQVARNVLLEAGANADFLTIPDFSRNDTFTVGPSLALQRKFGLGALAPVVRVDTGYTYKSARIEANSGWTAEATVSYSQRIIPSLRVTASGQALDHNARSSTYDIQQRTLSLQATWDINESWRLTGSVGRLTGRIVANAAPQIWAQAVSGGLGATVFNYYTTIPAEVVDSYGPGWVAYNLAAHADLWSLAVGYSVSEHTSLELRTSSVFVVNKIGIRYPNLSSGLGVVHRF